MDFFSLENKQGLNFNPLGEWLLGLVVTAFVHLFSQVAVACLLRAHVLGTGDAAPNETGETLALMLLPAKQVEDSGARWGRGIWGQAPQGRRGGTAHGAL